jgi:hypothetical protein
LIPQQPPKGLGLEVAFIPQALAQGLARLLPASFMDIAAARSLLFLAAG